MAAGAGMEGERSTAWGEENSSESESSSSSSSSSSVSVRLGTGSGAGPWTEDLAPLPWPEDPAPLPRPLPRAPPLPPLPRLMLAGENLGAGFLVLAPRLPPGVKEGVWPAWAPRFRRSTRTFLMKESMASSVTPPPLPTLEIVSISLRCGRILQKPLILSLVDRRRSSSLVHFGSFFLLWNDKPRGGEASTTF